MAITNPKEWKIPSRSWGITATDAADILLTAEEIKDHKDSKGNKSLLKAALVCLKAKKKAIAKVI